MKMLILLFSFMLGSAAIAQTGGTRYGYLSKDDQKYYKNDIMDGNNQRERTDSLVQEANKLHGEINAMKEEINQLRKDVDLLKSKK